MRLTLWLACLPMVAACSTNSNGGTSGGSTGGSSTGGSGGAWRIVALDASDGGDASDLALAVGAFDTVGVAYFLGQPKPATSDFQPHQIRYVQYVSGQVTAPSVVDTVEHPEYGLGLAIPASGLPAVAYLGGAPYGGDGGGASTYWTQSQALVSYQQADGSWSPQVANDAQGNPRAQTADGGVTPYQVMNLPVVLGLFSQLGFDSQGTAYDCFRDVNFGSSIGIPGDFADSNIDGEVGDGGSWNLEWAYAGGTWGEDGTFPAGLGGHLQLAMANDQPALVCDEFPSSGGDDMTGQNVDFLLRLGPTPANNWTVPQRILDVGATQTGPSMAYDPTFGFAVAVYDTGSAFDTSSEDELLFTSSTDGFSWTKPADVYSGAGGWYPSIAISPVSHQPAIADFLCSNQPNTTVCSPGEQAIEVRSYASGSFGPGAVVDPAGGFEPKIGFLSTGKMVIAYRQLPTYDLVLAVQQ